MLTHTLILPHRRNHKPRRFHLNLGCVALEEGWCSENQALPLTLSNVSKLIFFFFLLQLCTGTSSLENWTSTKTLPSMNECLCHYSPGVPGFWLREAAASSQATIASTVNCLPISPYIWSWVSQLSGKKLCPWRMSNCWCWERYNERLLFSHVDDVTLVTRFSGPHFIQDLVFYICTLWYSK